MDLQTADEVERPGRRTPGAQIALHPLDALSNARAGSVGRRSAYSSAVTVKSTAVTCHPDVASQLASDTRPQPASRARPNGASPQPAKPWAPAEVGGRGSGRSVTVALCVPL